MSNIKIRLTVVLPGSTLLSQEETCKLQNVTVKTESGKPVVKDGKVLTEPVLLPDKHKFNHFEIKVMHKGRPEVLKVATRKSKPAKQVIRLSEEAYKEFINSSIVPYKFKGVWKGLTDNQRIKWHCQQIADALGGTLDSFVVLE